MFLKWFKSLFAKKSAAPSEQETKPAKKTSIPWYDFAKKYEGKNESDPAFNKEMSKKWALFGMSLGTIQESWAAWCGLAVAVALAGAGVSYQKNGSLAKNWSKYGVGIEWKKNGIPKGSIIHINHASNCSSDSGNHVTMADGDCSAKDLLKRGATFNGLGGNQGNAWKVSTYDVVKICSVRWPSEFGLPDPVVESRKCTSGNAGGESTR
jgi:hypothetical protein